MPDTEEPHRIVAHAVGPATRLAAPLPHLPSRAGLGRTGVGRVGDLGGLLNLNSAIILSKPDLDKDSDVEENVEKASEITYVADANSAQARAGGKMGKGGGKTGGWPDGVGDEPVRFFRIKHAGPGWDDGMDEVSRADMNFLDEFKKVTGFKIARSR